MRNRGRGSWPGASERQIAAQAAPSGNRWVKSAQPDATAARVRKPNSGPPGAIDLDDPCKPGRGWIAGSSASRRDHTARSSEDADAE